MPRALSISIPASSRRANPADPAASDALPVLPLTTLSLAPPSPTPRGTRLHACACACACASACPSGRGTASSRASSGERAAKEAGEGGGLARAHASKSLSSAACSGAVLPRASGSADVKVRTRASDTRLRGSEGSRRRARRYSCSAPPKLSSASCILACSRRTSASSGFFSTAWSIKGRRCFSRSRPSSGKTRVIHTSAAPCPGSSART
mmetsp:Transcript_18241/g.26721  ORF Transcript_18241/g.26721 Transcript_18241/m.26721 type:complete len:209 (+) Transcript_18241:1641-2267(+)